MSPNPASPEVVEVAERSSIKGSRIEIDRFRSYRSPWAWSMLATSRRALVRVGVFRLFRAFRRVVFGHEAFCAEVRGSRGCAERAFSEGVAGWKSCGVAGTKRFADSGAFAPIGPAVVAERFEAPAARNRRCFQLVR